MKLLLLVSLCHASWIITTLQPTNYTVSAVSDLTFYLMATESILPEDCVTIQSELTYKNTNCTLLDQNTLLIQPANLQSRCTNLENPSSQKRVVFKITHLTNCMTPLPSKAVTIYNWIPKSLQASLSTSSQVIGYNKATLSLMLQPVDGIVVITAPYWYQSQSVQQDGVMTNVYSGCLVGYDSTVQGYDSKFTQNTLSISINTTSAVTLLISSFHNPITPQVPPPFLIQLTDLSGNLIAQTQALLSPVSIPTVFSAIQVQMLGDPQGQNQGMIVTLQTFKFTFALAFPLQPFCYFTIQLPPQLKNNINSIEGSGIFTPSYQSTMLNPSQHYTISGNQITVVGCLLPDYLTDSPYGSLTIQSIQMPEYIQQPDPIIVQVFSDPLQTQLLLSDSVSVDLNQLQPGPFEVIKFQPSNPYASAMNVAYNLQVIPYHSIPVGSKIVIQMPQSITFTNCTVLFGTCTLINNTITLTDLFLVNLTGGSTLKLTILGGNNPTGSQQAGPWSIQSLIKVGDSWYVRDYSLFQQSFFALSGSILSKILSSSTVVSDVATLSFSLQFEHEIPPRGSCLIVVPPELTVLQNATVTTYPYQISGNNITLVFSKGVETNLSLQVAGIQLARSFEASSAFQIFTKDANGLVIDIGGQDIFVEASQMASFVSLEIINYNLTNSAVTTLGFIINSKYPMIAGDTLNIILPQEVQTTTIECTLPCRNSNIRVQLQITATTLSLVFNITGIINPYSFKPSTPFQQIYVVDHHNQPSQQSLQLPVLKTSQVSQISAFNLTQQTVQYSQTGWMTLSFHAEISSDGVIVLQTPFPLPALTFCQVTTSKIVLRQVCTFQKNQVTIQNAFVEFPLYSGQVMIMLSAVTNPSTNQFPVYFNLQTFSSNYAISELRFQPQLQCQYPCNQCTQNACISCWPGMFLFNSTCVEKCPAGYSSNGTQQCQKCDFMCQTCEDNGKAGDANKCLDCATAFPFKYQQQCYNECGQGRFNDSLTSCAVCNTNCFQCKGSPNFCTQCAGSLPALYQQRCIDECPPGMVEILGTCQVCQAPCYECENQIDKCTSCDLNQDKNLLFGDKCYNQCPEGTTQVKNKCIGCKTGCEVCDNQDPQICLVCNQVFMTYNQNCYQTCPVGTIPSFVGKKCNELSAQDLKLVYFPFLILVLLLLIVSIVGKCVKPSHIILTNFVIFLGIVEHLAIVTQIVLTFIFGTYYLAIAVIVIWVAYILVAVSFNIKWRVVANEIRYQVYLQHSENKISSRLTFLASFISWRVYKLLYSHCFGIKVNPYTFTQSQPVYQLMTQVTIANLAVTYLPLSVLCLIGLFTTKWGTQLQIMFVENLVISIVSAVVSVIEHKKLKLWLQEMAQFQNNIKYTQQSIGKKYLKIQFHTVPLTSSRAIFQQHKLDELLSLFGSRKCQSLQNHLELEKDPRVTKSYPLSPDIEMHVDDPPRPIIISNCQKETFKEAGRKMVKNSAGVHKCQQIGDPLDNDLLRADTSMMSRRDDLSEHKVTQRRKSRGRRGLADDIECAIIDEDRRTVQDYTITDEILQKKRIVQKQPVSAKKASSVKAGNFGSISTGDQKKSLSPNSKKAQSIDSRKSIKSQRQSPNRVQSPKDQVLKISSSKVIKSTSSKSKKSISPESSQIRKQSMSLSKVKKPTKNPEPSLKDSNKPKENTKQILYNLDKVAFELVDVCGSLNGSGRIDQKGPLCNSKGYLVNKNGDIVNRKGKVLFKAKDLVDGEFPRIIITNNQGFETTDGIRYQTLKGKLVRQDFSQMLGEIEDELIQNKSIDQLESLSQKKQIRTFYHKSPRGLNSASSSDGQTQRSKNRKYNYKVVKEQKMYQVDVQMANAYGGEPVPRTRLVRKRYRSNVRDRGSVLRDSSILSPQILQQNELEKNFVNDCRESNQDLVKKKTQQFSDTSYLYPNQVELQIQSMCDLSEIYSN